MDIASKKSIFEFQNCDSKPKESYSSAFLEILNSEVIENSSKNSHHETERELSGLNFDFFKECD
jgi:hypothetical protein